MARNAQQAPKASDEAFNDILTCLAGILILIIIMVVLDSKQNKILIPTPIEQNSLKDPVYIEVGASGALFSIPVQELDRMAVDKLGEVAEECAGDRYKMLRSLSSASNKVGNADYEVDLLSKLTGNTVLRPKPDAVGHALPTNISITAEESVEIQWYNSVLKSIDNDNQYISFIVRSSDDSYRSFKRARALAWLNGTQVAYALIENTELIEFGLGGNTLNIQ
jgi:hypothetical protein